MRIISLVILVLLSVFPCWAQYSFRTIDVRSGLSDNFVRSILKDSQGFLWFGTLNGVSRYDGFQVKTYDIIDSDGATNNNILSIAQDKAQQIWLTTLDGSIFIYDPESDAFELNAADHLAQMGIAVSNPKLTVDQDQNLWVSTTNKLILYNFDSRRLQTVNLPEPVKYISCRSSHAYALGEKRNIYSLDLSQNEAHFLASYPAEANDISLYQDSQRNLWLFDKYVPGLYVVKNAGSQSTTLTKVSDEYVSGIAEDREGNLWIGTNSNGVIVRHPDGSQISITRDNQSASNTLPSNHVNTILIDSDNVVWVGSSKSGVSMASIDGNGIQIVDTPFNEDIGFICQDSHGDLWIGYDGSGLYSVADGDHYTAENGSQMGDLVIGGRLESDGHMYVGTYGNGIFRMDAKRHVSRIAEEHPQVNHARRIIRDRSGQLWVGAVMNGLCCISPNGRFSQFTHHNSALLTSAITDVDYSSGEDRLLVATGTGLYSVNCATREISAVADTAIQNATVNVVLFGSHGLRWAATASGLRVYDKDFRLVRTWGRDFDMGNILAMTLDHEKWLWLTTNDAVFCIEVTAKEDGAFDFNFKRLSVGDAAMTFCKKAIFCTADGEVLAGGTGRYVRITPSQSVGDFPQNNVIFTEIKVGTRSIPVASSEVNSLKLSAGDDITLSVSNLDFRNAPSAKFAYQVDNQEWMPMDGSSVTISDFESGEHVLRIKSLGDGDAAAAVLEFVALQAGRSWYAYIVFFIICVLIGGGIAVYMHHLRRHENSSEPSGDIPNHAIDVAEQEFLDRATKIVEVHLADADFSVEIFSAEMNQSRSALYKKLMAITGKSPLEFIRSIRLRHGFELIRQGGLSVSEVAFRTGFSPKQFSKFFREEYGVLPSQWGKMSVPFPI